MSTTTSVASAADLLPLVELTAITTYEVGGRRGEEKPDDAGSSESSDDFQIKVRLSDSDLETRARVRVDSAQAELIADVSATYTFTEPLELSREVVGEFVERVGVMSVFPYLREAIHTTASRLGVDAPVLGLLRAGSFRLNISEDGDEAPSV
jgi:hypothetical protein